MTTPTYGPPTPPAGRKLDESVLGDRGQQLPAGLNVDRLASVFDVTINRISALGNAVQEAINNVRIQVQQRATFGGNSQQVNDARMAQRQMVNDPLIGQTTAASLSANGAGTLGNAMVAGTQQVMQMVQPNLSAAPQIASATAGMTTAAGVAAAAAAAPSTAPPGPGGVSGGGGGGGGAPTSGGSGYSGGRTGLEGALRRNLPGAGMAISLIRESRNQWEKNRAYQEVTGESNFAGFGERLSEEWRAKTTGWNPFNPMGEQRARQAFKDATSLGLRGDSRDEAIDVATQNFKQRGMEITDTMQFISVALENGRVALHDLSASLDEVTDSARDAGVNTKLARDNMLKVFQVASNAGFGGASPQLAANATANLTSYGRAFQNTDTSAAFSLTQTYRMAALAGVSGAEFQRTVRKNPRALDVARTADYMQIIRNIIGDDGIAAVRAKVQEAGGVKRLRDDPEVAAYIGQQMVDEEWGSLGVNPPEVIANQINLQTGLNLTGANVMAWIVQNAGGNDPASQAAQRVGGERTRGGKVASGERAGQQGMNLSEEARAVTQSGKFQSDNTAAGAYGAWQKRSGMEDPVMATLLGNLGEDANWTEVEVRTREGTRRMKLSEAIKHYPEQLSSGKVKVVTGEGKGKTVQQITGFANQQITQKEIEEEINQAKVVGDKVKKKDKGGDAPSGKFILEPTEELRRFFRTVPASEYEASAAAGLPPEISSNGSRGQG